MPIYTCQTCKKKFDIRRLYNNHLTRKNPCKSDNFDNKCSYCSKSYTTTFNLNKHLKICKEKIIEYLYLS